MQGLPRLPRLLPASIGGQCILALLFGILAAVVLGPRAECLMPLGEIFLRASQIAVMPYLICELVASLGSLQPASMRLLSRIGGLVLLAILASGALMVVLLPAVLPDLISSSFFRPEMLQRPDLPDLVGLYLPFNIFSALADNNFPAVVLFAAVLGVLLQGLPERQLLLQPLEQLRLLFRRMNKLVARIAPIGIFGLAASTLASLSPELLLRSQALLVLNLVALVLLVVLWVTVIVVLTPLDLAATWRILRGPLAITASSANLLIALPLLNEGLTEEMACLLPDAEPAARQRALDEISTIMPVGFALPNLGQVVSLMFLPFAAWFVDQPMDRPAILRMLATAIPSVTGGLKSAVRLELQQLGLPANLIGLVQINGEWIYREEKVLSLLGLSVLVILVVCFSLGALRFRPVPLLRGGVIFMLLAAGLGVGSSLLLARNLAGTYRNDRLLLSRSSALPAIPLQVVSCRNLGPAPINLDAVEARGVLRVGLRGDQPPWVFRNRVGGLVGYDLDVMKAFARNLGVRLQVCEGTLPHLQELLSQQRVDLVIGGIHDRPLHSLRFLVSGSYQKVHLALVAPDDHVPMLQNLAERPLNRPLRLAVLDRDVITPALRDQLADQLGSANRAAALQMERIPSQDAFINHPGRYDALLTTAEGGASLAVLHPNMTMMPVFGADFNSGLVVLVGGSDRGFLDFVDDWLAREEGRGRLSSLFKYWALLDQPLKRS